MLRNYLTSTIRSLTRKKVFSTINVLGLAVGMAASLLILIYVQFEFSYDDIHSNSDRIYRIRLDQYKNGELIFASSENYPGAAPALVKELPEVLASARLYNLGAKNNMVVTYEEAPGGPIDLKTSSLMYADSSFLNMFSYEVVQGDPVTALAKPYSMVITESVAYKYFGNNNPLGQSLRMRDDDFNDEKCIVTAVVQDPPTNTHLKFDFLISYSTLYARGEWAPSRYDLSWARKDMYSYILTEQGANPEAIEQKLPGIIEKYNPELKAQGREDVLLLQPLREIHLYSNLTDEVEANGNGKAVTFLFVIGIFILLMAWVNYINLSTSKAMERAAEVGVRKAIGASGGQLFGQFMMEAFLVNLFALAIALLLVFVSIPFFRDTLELQFATGFWTSLWFIATCIGMLVIGIILSGTYPSLVLSSYKPALVLKGKSSGFSRGAVLRKALVIFQFGASVFLISGTLLIQKQLSFMNDQDLGYNMDQTLVFQRPGVVERDFEQLRQQYDNLKTEVGRLASVDGVGGSFFLPGKKLRFKAEVKVVGQPDDAIVPIALSGMDYDLLDLLEMNMAAGRQFSKDYPSDADTAVIITRSAAALLGFETPEAALGQAITVPDFELTRLVVGVAEDYHQESLAVETQPTFFFLQEFGLEYYMVKLNTSDLPGTISAIEDLYASVFPGNPFDYFFLDEYFNDQYQNEQKFAGLFSFFAALAIFIGCLGLLGLSAYTAQQRTKEIGIRKVLGSSVGQIILLLNKDFLILILISFVISVPLVYYVMNEWLLGFAYRISFDFLLTLAAGALVVLISFSTVTLQTLRTARTSPAVSLKDE